MMLDCMKSTDIIGGKYRLTHRLGSGAMGVVWAAINKLTGRRVALKLIVNPTDDLRQRLLREGRACGKLMHRNIVEVYDVGETQGGDPFLVMQLLSGETLAEMLRRKRRVSPRLVARIGADIASALAAAHEAKIIHRDLKPANIFMHREDSTVESEFLIKVLDFGVCKNLATRDGPSTTTGMLIGSVPYMSPEQVRVVKDLDHRTDIWSLGIILFELLTGVRPFRGTMEEVVGQILMAPIPPVSSLVWRIPSELDAIVARCLSRDREARIHDAKELSRMLSAYAEASRTSRVVVNVEAPPATTAQTDDDDATTLSLDKGKQFPDLLRYREMPGTPKPSAERSETKTEILSPTAPIASAMPTWRQKLQLPPNESQKSRPSSSASNAEDLAQGGTLALAVEALHEPKAPAKREGAPIPSIAPLVQQVAAEPASGELAPEAMNPAQARSRRAWRHAAMALGLASLAALVAAAGMSWAPGRSKGVEAAAPPSRESKPLEQRATLPTPPLPATNAVVTPPPSSSVSAPALPSASAKATPPPHPSSTSRIIAPRPVSVSRPRPTAQPHPAVKPSEPCGRFLKRKNCP